jgi:hypothetical protein
MVDPYKTTSGSKAILIEKVQKNFGYRVKEPKRGLIDLHKD